jgi:hypothetical protein
VGAQIRANPFCGTKKVWHALGLRGELLRLTKIGVEASGGC